MTRPENTPHPWGFDDAAATFGPSYPFAADSRPNPWGFDAAAATFGPSYDRSHGLHGNASPGAPRPCAAGSGRAGVPAPERGNDLPTEITTLYHDDRHE